MITLTMKSNMLAEGCFPPSAVSLTRNDLEFWYFGKVLGSQCDTEEIYILICWQCFQWAWVWHRSNWWFDEVTSKKSSRIYIFCDNLKSYSFIFVSKYQIERLLVMIRKAWMYLISGTLPSPPTSWDRSSSRKSSHACTASPCLSSRTKLSRIFQKNQKIKQVACIALPIYAAFNTHTSSVALKRSPP